MADIIKFVLPEPPPRQCGLTDEEFEIRLARIAMTASGAMEAMQLSLEEEGWSLDNANDLSTLAHELGNLFQVAATLIAKRTAKKD